MSIDDIKLDPYYTFSDPLDYFWLVEHQSHILICNNFGLDTECSLNISEFINSHDNSLFNDIAEFITKNKELTATIYKVVVTALTRQFDNSCRNEFLIGAVTLNVIRSFYCGPMPVDFVDHAESGDVYTEIETQNEYECYYQALLNKDTGEAVHMIDLEAPTYVADIRFLWNTSLPRNAYNTTEKNDIINNIVFWVSSVLNNGNIGDVITQGMDLKSDPYTITILGDSIKSNFLYNSIGLTAILKIVNIEVSKLNFHKLLEYILLLLQKLKIVKIEQTRLVYNNNVKTITHISFFSCFKAIEHNYNFFFCSPNMLKINNNYYNYNSCLRSITSIIVNNAQSTKTSYINPEAIKKLNQIPLHVDYRMLAIASRQYLLSLRVNGTTCDSLETFEYAQEAELIKLKNELNAVNVERSSLNSEFYKIIYSTGGSKRLLYILSKFVRNGKFMRKRTKQGLIDLVPEDLDIITRYYNNNNQKLDVTIREDYKNLIEYLQRNKQNFGGSYTETQWPVYKYFGFSPLAMGQELDIIQSKKMDIYKKTASIRSNINKIYSKVLEARAIIRTTGYLCKVTRPFFLQHYYDFRGRVYCRSSCSVIKSKWLRSIYHYGNVCEVDFIATDAKLLSSTAFNMCLPYIKKVQSVFNIVLRPSLAQALLWCLIDIAKVFKNKLIKDNTIDITTFINYGINYYFGYKAGIAVYADNFEEILEIHKLLLVIEELLSGKLQHNYVLNKDSTASVLQQLLLILGPLNEEAIKVCNLGGGTVWSDPYTAIIEDFFKKYKVPAKIKKFFIRRCLKRTIMTFHYAVTLQTAFNYFISECGSLEKNDFDTAKLLPSFKVFFHYLKFEHELQVLYKNRSVDLIGLVSILEFNDGSKVPLVYHASKVKRAEINSTELGVRKTFTYKVLDGSVENTIKIKNASRANIIHAHDAYLLRAIVCSLPILTVHDTFCSGVLDICFLIDLLNIKVKQPALKKTIIPGVELSDLTAQFSLFIVL